nr:cation diffusion facilitator family transporter [Acetobacter ghanensis]
MPNPDEHMHDHAGHSGCDNGHAHASPCTHEHEHEHEHEHDGNGASCGHKHGFGHHHVHTPASFDTAFAIGIAVNTLYLAAEAVWGVYAHSLSLIADAGHNLSDVLALAAAWLAEHLSRRSPTARFTYGLRRSSILAALANAIILMLVTGGVAWEAIHRLIAPTPVAGTTMMVVAGIGILVNGASAMLFAAGQKGDLNIRGAFLHLMADALTSLAVVVAGGLVLLTHIEWIDPAISLAISVIVVLSTWSLLRDSLDMALDAVPREVDPGAVERFLRGTPGVADLHDLHIWPISTTETALTVHLVRSAGQMDGENDARLLDTLVTTLRKQFGIAHPTLQMETQEYGPTCHLSDPHTV